jgi:hypothetical protein
VIAIMQELMLNNCDARVVSIVDEHTLTGAVS